MQSWRPLSPIYLDGLPDPEPVMGFEQVYPATGTDTFEPVAE
jgi:hypothetical protein